MTSLYYAGEILTMVSVDAERVWLGLLYMHWLWIGPVMAIIAMVLLILEVGWSGFAALGTMIVLNIIQKYAGEYVGRTRKSFVKYTAARTLLMNETLQVCVSYSLLTRVPVNILIGYKSDQIICLGETN